MQDYVIKLAKTTSEIKGTFDVIRQLRTDYSLESYVNYVKSLQETGFYLAYLLSGDKVICVSGFRIDESLSRRKYLYIDDLVTLNNARSTGAGKHMIDWLKRYANEYSCNSIHLDSGVQRHLAHRFYFKNSFDISSHHFKHDF